MKDIIERLLKSIVKHIGTTGRGIKLSFEVIYYLFRKPFFGKNFVDQLVRIGYDSIPVVMLTAISTGMVFALQLGFTLEARLQGTSQYIGSVVGLSFVRELGPTLMALMITGRVGSAIAAEIGTMKVTEQIDALTMLSTNPVQYLAVPRFLAAIIVFPILTMFADLVGVIGGSIVATTMFNQNLNVYVQQTALYVGLSDIAGGLIKASVFGGIMAIIGCFQGFETYGGAEGVGKSTTRAVVMSSISIIVSDYFMNAIIIRLFSI